jgi:transcriptional regulator with XRE-family HTH domain
MRNMRRLADWTIERTANEFGCSPSHISRVERGQPAPSRELVQFYEDTFEGDGLLHSLYEAVTHIPEQNRRRTRGRSGIRTRAIPGDATAYVDETIPSGTLMAPGLFFVKTWRIRNVGSVPWRGRRLEREGPLSGPGLIMSFSRSVEIPDTDPGEICEIQVPLRAPGYDCSSIAYFKMIDADGLLCFPDEHQLGLDVLVLVRRNTAGSQ